MESAKKEPANVKRQTFWNNYVYIRDRYTFQHLGNGTVVRVNDPTDGKACFYLFTIHSMLQNKKWDDIVLVFPNDQGKLEREYSVTTSQDPTADHKLTLFVEESLVDPSLDLSVICWKSSLMDFVKPVSIYTGQLDKNYKIAILQWVTVNARLMYTQGKISAYNDYSFENTAQVTSESKGSPCFIFLGDFNEPLLVGIHKEFIFAQGKNTAIPFHTIWNALQNRRQ